MALYVNGRQVSGGGGGDASKRELTWAEYQALTEAEKNNGTMYFCNDVNGDGSEFQPVIYSEEEREIGVWTDGKPLYQKTVTLEQTMASQEYYTLISDSTFTLIGYNSDGTRFIRNNGQVWSPSFGYDGGTVFIYQETNGDIKFSYNVSGVVIIKAEITLLYTKTTDQAGSGTWTPQGVPAHHYSTDERVVGTWVDGSTLYEKTLHTTTAVNLNTQTWTQIPWENEPSNINRLISAELIGVVPNTYMGIRFGLDSGHIKAAASVGGTFPTGIGQTDGNEYVTIRYTKTTT